MARAEIHNIVLFYKDSIQLPENRMFSLVQVSWKISWEITPAMLREAANVGAAGASVQGRAQACWSRSIQPHLLLTLETAHLLFKLWTPLDILEVAKN